MDSQTKKWVGTLGGSVIGPLGTAAFHSFVEGTLSV